jgi:curved DNA-binding protein CbpA
MAGPRSHYAVLNVSPDADPSVIEAAYRALIKKYHPDKRQGDAPSDRTAAQINEAYAVLRNPARRTEYDAAERARRLPVLIARPQPAMVPPRPRRRWALLIPLAGAAAAAAGLVFTRETPPAAQPVAVRPTQPAGVAELAAAAEPVDRENVVRAVAEFDRVQARSGAGGAVAYSQRCFEAQGRSRELRDFDFCIAFDEAASAFESRTGAEREGRFHPYNLSIRHLGAGRRISTDMAWVGDRLEELRASTERVLSEREAPVLVAVVRRVEPEAAPPPIPLPKTIRSKPEAPADGPADDSDFLEREGLIY